MLSTAPVPTPQTELAAEMQIFSVQLGSEVMRSDFALIGSTGITTGITNSYGGPLHTSGGIVIVPAITNGNQHEPPWAVIQAPIIDPIGLPALQTPTHDESAATIPARPTPPAYAPAAAPVNSPVYTPVAAPINSPVYTPVAAPVRSPVVSPVTSHTVTPVAEPVSAPSPAANPDPANSRSPIVDTAPNLPSSPTRREPASERARLTTLAAPATDAASIKPRWLPATFTPAEQHRTDVQSFDVSDARASESHGSRSPSALQPTRVTCQAFCDAEPTQVSLGAWSAEFPSDPVRQQENSGADALPAVSRFPGDDRTAPALQVALTYDAAILNWEASRESPGDVPTPANGSSPADVVPATPPVDTVGDKPATGENAASVWDVDRRLVVPLLAAAATQRSGSLQAR